MSIPYRPWTPAPSGGSIDADATAWKNAVVTAGGTVSAGRLTLVSNLIGSLKSGSVWATLDRLWIFAAENTTSALLDMKGLATASAVSSPTFTADRGYTGSTTAYVDTNFNPTTATSPQFVQDSAHIAFYLRTNLGATATVQMGATDAGNAAVESVKWSDGNTYASLNDGNGDGGRAGPSNTSGIWVWSRTDSTGVAIYQGGSSIGTASATSTGVSNFTFLVNGARKSVTGNTYAYGTSAEFAMASIGSGLDSTKAGAFTTAVQTYMTAVGA